MPHLDVCAASERDELLAALREIEERAADLANIRYYPARLAQIRRIAHAAIAKADEREQARVEPQWLPIEIAPKEPRTKPTEDAFVELGPRLLFWSSGSGHWPVTGQWVEPHHGRGWWGMDAIYGIPTHWQPVPDPPAEGE